MVHISARSLVVMTVNRHIDSHQSSLGVHVYKVLRECMMAVDHKIWRFCISLLTKLHSTALLHFPVFLYGTDAWAMTVTTAKTFDVLDRWCLHRILNIPWTDCIANNEVLSRTQ